MAVIAAGNVTVSYGADGAENALTAYLNTTSVEAVVNQIDATDFSSTGTESIAGLPSWSVPIGGHWDSTLDGYLGPDAVAPPATLRSLLVAITDAGSTTITYDWGPTAAYISGYTINASSPAEGITWSGTLTCSGTPTRS